MNERVYKLNMLYAIVDGIVCILSVVCFGVAAYFANHWWINLFGFVPLFLFSSHTLIIDADLDAAKDGEQDG